MAVFALARCTARVWGRGGTHLGVACLLGSGLWACNETYEPPTAPDMQALVDDYEHPRGELDPDQLEAVLTQALPFLGAIQLMDHFEFLSTAVEGAKQGFEIRGLDFDGDLPVVGEVALHVICPGFAPAEPPNAADNGTVKLLMPIRHGRLGPSGGGHADGCRFNGDASRLADYIVLPGDLAERNVEIDGALNVHLGAAVELGKPADLKPLVQIEGRIEVEGVPPFERFDFRVPSPGTSEASVTVAGQQVVVFSDPIGVGVREQRGVWLCEQADLAQCIADF